MAMVPAWQFTNWQWLSLTLAAPVVVWGAWPFHRAALGQPAPRRRDHGHPDLGRHPAPRSPGRCRRCSSAPPGEPGMTHPFELTVRAERRRAATSTSRSPPGSPCSSWPAATSRSGPSGRPAPPCAPCCDLGAKDVAVLRDGTEIRIPVDQLVVGDVFVVRPGEKIATDGVVVDGQLRRRRLDAHRRVGAGRGRPRRRRGRRDRQRRRAAAWSAPPGSAPTPSWRRWPGWSRTPRPARPRCSAWPTGSPASSCPVVIALAVATLGGWLAPGSRLRPRRSPPPSPC